MKKRFLCFLGILFAGSSLFAQSAASAGASGGVKYLAAGIAGHICPIENRRPPRQFQVILQNHECRCKVSLTLCSYAGKQQDKGLEQRHLHRMRPRNEHHRPGGHMPENGNEQVPDLFY